jgi:hypothetical protein
MWNEESREKGEQAHRCGTEGNRRQTKRRDVEQRKENKRTYVEQSIKRRKQPSERRTSAQMWNRRKQTTNQAQGCGTESHDARAWVRCRRCVPQLLPQEDNLAWRVRVRVRACVCVRALVQTQSHGRNHIKSPLSNTALGCYLDWRGFPPTPPPPPTPLRWASATGTTINAPHLHHRKHTTPTTDAINKTQHQHDKATPQLSPKPNLMPRGAATNCCTSSCGVGGGMSDIQRVTRTQTHTHTHTPSKGKCRVR